MKIAGELRPGIGGAHVDNAHRLNARLRRLDPKQGRGLAAFDTAPEFPLGGDDEVLVERIGVGLDLDPFAAAGNDREDRRSCRHDPHIVLQLRHIFLRRRFLRERPGQHELGFEHGLAALHAAIEGGPHPAQDWMPDLPLHVGNDLPGVGLIPAPVELLGHRPQAGR